MGDLAFRVENVGKLYRIGELSTHRTLRETLTEAVARPIRGIRRRMRGEWVRRRAEGSFWALDDVSFDVMRGEILGIIGRNGAGKTTLFKILSRITDPTRGRVECYGRVGSLLEVGTGFHPELTGRENIFLNGAILGMSRSEISHKFDEIVEFSEIERFLDTPVKRYSSGMYVRLAFAVAAHLEPEILLVDEVLAVGDLEFQKKCLGKMGTVAREGRTVLFISHNMAAIRTLCSHALLLDRGRITCRGGVGTCVAEYLSRRNSDRGDSWERPPGMRPGPLSIESVKARLVGRQPDHALELEIGLVTLGRHRPATLAVDIMEVGGTTVMQALPRLDGFIPDVAAAHVVEVSIELPGLVPGEYLATIWVGPHNEETLDQADEVVSFVVTESPTPGRSYPHTADHGFVVPSSSATYRHR